MVTDINELTPFNIVVEAAPVSARQARQLQHRYQAVGAVGPKLEDEDDVLHWLTSTPHLRETTENGILPPSTLMPMTASPSLASCGVGKEARILRDRERRIMERSTVVSEGRTEGRSLSASGISEMSYKGQGGSRRIEEVTSAMNNEVRALLAKVVNTSVAQQSVVMLDGVDREGGRDEGDETDGRRVGGKPGRRGGGGSKNLPRRVKRTRGHSITSEDDSGLSLTGAAAEWGAFDETDGSGDGGIEGHLSSVLPAIDEETLMALQATLNENSTNLPLLTPGLMATDYTTIFR